MAWTRTTSYTLFLLLFQTCHPSSTTTARLQSGRVTRRKATFKYPHLRRSRPTSSTNSLIPGRSLLTNDEIQDLAIPAHASSSQKFLESVELTPNERANPFETASQHIADLDSRRAAAGVVMFKPLPCNDDIDQKSCDIAISSIMKKTTAGEALHIPCGTCVIVDNDDGATLEFPDGILVEGKLFVPSTANVTLRTVFVIVTGVWKMEEPEEGNKVVVHLFGEELVSFTPFGENEDACDGSCEIGSKPIAVMGGQLDIVGYNSTCPSWEKLQSISTTTHPSLLNLPLSCPRSAQNLILHPDGTLPTKQNIWWGWNNTISTIQPGYPNTGTAFAVYPRADRGLNRGLAQEIPVECIKPDSTWRLTFKTKLVFPEGSTLRANETCIPSHSTFNCPLILLRTSHHSNQRAKSHYIRDINMSWSYDEWNTYDTTLFFTSDLFGETLTRLQMIFTGGPNDSILLVDDISLTPTYPTDVIKVSPEAARCWGTEGNELVISSHTRSHKDHQRATISSVISVDDGLLRLTRPLKHTTTTLSTHPEYAVEVGLLTRSIVFEAEDDARDDLIGGHLIVERTSGVRQRIEGVEVKNFGQQGRLGRYPIHIHLCEDGYGSVVRNNVVRDANQRCYVVHGTNGVLWEGNIAYESFGHCYFTEDGSEEENIYTNNLGLGMKFPSRLLSHLSGRNETDIEPAVFWVANPQNHFTGNVAAGSDFYGWWFELHQRIRGPSRYINPTLNPQQLTLGAFLNNTSHSANTMSFSVYPPAFHSTGLSTFTNLKIYRNGYMGLFVHLTRNLLFENLLVGDNGRFATRANQADGVVFRNSKIVGVSPGEDRPPFCSQDSNMTAMILGPTMFPLYDVTGEVEGVTFDNVTFEYWDEEETGCGRSVMLRIDHSEVFIPEWDAIHRLANFSYPPRINKVDACFTFEQRGLKQVVLEDPMGLLGPNEGRGGFILNKGEKHKFLDVDKCVDYGGCLDYCEGACLRTVRFLTSCQDASANTTLIISNGYKTMSISPSHDERFNPLRLITQSSVYFVALPKADYTIHFENENGVIDWPDYVIPVLSTPPLCEDYVEEEDITIIKPEPERPECDELIYNGQFDEDISSWLDFKSGILWSETEGAGGTGALKTVNRTDERAHYIAQYVDVSCFQENTKWDVTVKYRLIDENGTNAVACENSRTGGACPMGAFVYFYKNPFNHTFVETWMDGMLTERPYRMGEEWNTMSGMLRVDKKRTMATKVLFSIGMGNGQFLIDNVSVKKIYTEAPSTNPSSRPSVTAVPTGTPTLLCVKNLIRNGDVSLGIREWYPWGTKMVYEEGYGGRGSAVAAVDRESSLKGLYQDIDIPCMTEGSVWHVMFKVKLYEQKTGDGVDCDPSDTRSYQCPLVRIQRVSQDETADYFLVRDTDMDWNPNGWNTFEAFIEITEEMIGSEDTKYYRPIFSGGPEGSVLVLDDVMWVATTPEPTSSPSTVEHMCSQEMVINQKFSDGTIDGWHPWGTDIDIESPGYNNKKHAIKAYNRDGPIRGMYVDLKDECLIEGNVYRVAFKTKLYDQQSGMGIDCDPSNRHYLDCPFVRVQTITDGVSQFVSVRDHSMEWDKNDWNTFIAVFIITEEMIGASDFRALFVGGPANSVLVLDSVSWRETTPEPTPGPTLSMAPTNKYCDELVNDGSIESDGTSNWKGWGNPIAVVKPGFDDTGFAISAYQRDSWVRGIYQDFNMRCLQEGLTYLIEFRVRMYMENDGKGIDCDPTIKDGHENCPFVRIQTVKGDVVNYKNIFDHNMNWNNAGWNTFNTLATISEEMSGSNLDIFRALYVGGPAGSVLVLDDISWKLHQTPQPSQKLAAIPESTIPPTTPEPTIKISSTPTLMHCNQLVPFDGTSPDEISFWKGWGNKIGMITPGYDGKGYAIKAYERTSWVRGMYTAVPLECLEYGTEWQFTFKTKLIDATTGDGLDCNPKGDKDISCPLVRINISRFTGKSKDLLVRDTSIVWDKDSWNTFTGTLLLDDDMTRNDLKRVRFGIIGGRPESVLVVDDIAWTKKTGLSSSLSPTVTPPSSLSPTLTTPSSLSPTIKPPSTLSPTLMTPSSLSPTIKPPSTLSPTLTTPSSLSPTIKPPSTLSPTMTPVSSIVPRASECHQLLIYNGKNKDDILPWNAWGGSIAQEAPGYDNVGSAMKIYSRDNRAGGLYQILPMECLEHDSKWTISFKAKLYDEATGKGIFCDPTESSYTSCPFVRLLVKRPGRSFDVKIRDRKMQWNPDGWNTFTHPFTVFKKMTRHGISSIRCVFVGGPPNSVLLLDQVSWIRDGESPTSTPVLEVDKCKELASYDGESEKELGLWNGWRNEIGLETPGYGNKKFALKAFGRKAWLKGVFKMLPSNCLEIGARWVITFKTKLYDEKTGKGISCDPTEIGYTSCPLIRFRLKKKDGNHDFLLRDNSMKWNADDWNTFRGSFVVTDYIAGKDVKNIAMVFVGGTPGSVLVIGDISTTKITQDETRIHEI